jgi:PEP-CTERM motif
MRLVRDLSMCLGRLFGLLLITVMTQVMAPQCQAGICSVTITLSGTVNTADEGMGFTVGQAVSFYWVINNYAPQTPEGTTYAVEHRWTQENAGSEPRLFAEVGGTGIGGTFQEGSGGTPWDRIRVRPLDSVIDNYDDFEVQMRSDGFNANTNNRGIYLSSNPTFFVSSLYFDGDIINPPWPQSEFVNGGTLPDPTAFFSKYLGTYAVNNSYNSRELNASNGSQNLRATFNFDTMTLSSTCPVPEPSTMAIFGLGALGMAYRAKRKLKP